MFLILRIKIAPRRGWRRNNEKQSKNHKKIQHHTTMQSTTPTRFSSQQLKLCMQEAREAKIISKKRFFLSLPPCIPLPTNNSWSLSVSVGLHRSSLTGSLASQCEQFAMNHEMSDTHDSTRSTLSRCMTYLSSSYLFGL